MTDNVLVPADVAAYYEANVEADRLAAGTGALEFERTKEIVSRFLPAQAMVVDVGGGTGRYAEWLAETGRRVELVEPVPLHVKLARERAADPPRFGVQLGEARALPFPEGSCDGVLLLGPLYHLGEERDRVDVLREAARICRAGGVVFAAAISRLAPLLDMVGRGSIGSAEIFANVQAETVTGRRVGADRRRSPFPDAYFHLPGELEAELRAAGLRVEGVFGVEGPGWLLPGLAAEWGQEEVRERVLAAARAFESEPHLIGVSAHLLGVATKPRA